MSFAWTFLFPVAVVNLFLVGLVGGPDLIWSSD